MKSQITRRDFLNGVALGFGASTLVPYPLFGMNNIPPGSDYYPPTLTGLRGSHAGSFETAHALAWRGEKPADYQALDEHYDLVVVGAGMSGLAAAGFYRKKMGPEAHILLLDNHDDFGGHAKRNEFHYQGKMLLGIGGAQNLEMPEYYSDVAKSVLSDLGIDTEQMRDNMAPDYPLAGLSSSLEMGVALPGPEGHELISGQWLNFMHGQGDYKPAVRSLPLPRDEQDRLIAFFGGEIDFLDELSLGEKYHYAKTTSYYDFLRDRVGLSDNTLPLMDSLTKSNMGFGGWGMSVFEAISLGAPGLQAFGWLGELADSLVIKLGSFYEARYFADGNASVARLLVHKMIPAVAPGSTGFEDIATARFDYSVLDKAQHATRLRLNSTVVGARNVAGDKVEVDYVRQGSAERVTADHCVLACYNGLIPHLCPELPEAQKQNLKYGVKVPLVYANVLLRDGKAFSRLGSKLVVCPQDEFEMVTCSPPTTTGGFQPPSNPEEPMVAFLWSAPTTEPKGNESVRDQFRLARHQLYARSFEDYEASIRKQLQGLLGSRGFNHAEDIVAITVNRWSHGYAYD